MARINSAHLLCFVTSLLVACSRQNPPENPRAAETASAAETRPISQAGPPGLPDVEFFSEAERARARHYWGEETWRAAAESRGTGAAQAP